MTAKQHKEYIKELKAVTAKLMESKEASQEFYISIGIHTKEGKLHPTYNPSKIGYKTSSSKK